MILRHAADTLRQLARGYPVLAITGPRQSGKTTLARAVFSDKRYVSLEDPDQRAFADEDPRGFLDRFPDGAILDEVQRCPALFSYLQGRVDADRRMGQFVLTGSQQFGLLAQITQSLAGRVGLVQLLPFAYPELTSAGKAVSDLDTLLWQGLYPPLHDRPLDPVGWYANYVMTYIERDVRQLSEVRNLAQFQRFLRLCAGRNGQLLNLSSLGNDCGISHVTARSWLSILEAGYIVHLLQPHHANFGKRLVKAPKLYFHDTGLAAYLLGIRDPDHLAIHPSRGALFETFVIGELLKHRYNRGLPSNLYFWRSNVGDEVDVLIDEGTTLQPVEIKSGKTLLADHTAGIRKWLAIAGPAALDPRMVYGGDESVTRSGIRALSWREI